MAVLVIIIEAGAVKRILVLIAVVLITILVVFVMAVVSIKYHILLFLKSLFYQLEMYFSLPLFYALLLFLKVSHVTRRAMSTTSHSRSSVTQQSSVSESVIRGFHIMYITTGKNMLNYKLLESIHTYIHIRPVCLY